MAWILFLNYICRYNLVVPVFSIIRVLLPLLEILIPIFSLSVILAIWELTGTGSPTSNSDINTSRPNHCRWKYAEDVNKNMSLIPICFFNGPMTVPTTFKVFPGEMDILSREPFLWSTTVVTLNHLLSDD